MIPVRVPATFIPYVVRDDIPLAPTHPLYGTYCPVCGGPLGVESDVLEGEEGGGSTVSLVAVGIHPDDRKDYGWTTAGAVTVHSACTLSAEESQANISRALNQVRRDLVDAIVGRVLTAAMEETSTSMAATQARIAEGKKIPPEERKEMVHKADRLAGHVEMLTRISQLIADEFMPKGEAPNLSEVVGS